MMRARLVGLLMVVASVLAAAPKHYALTGDIPVPGNSFWDYLTADAANHRLYVSHGTEVAVIDLNSRQVIGTIPNTNGVHGIALAPELGKGFVSAGRDNQIVVFDMKTLKVEKTVKAGTNPDGIVYDAVTKKVFAFNGRSKDATSYDAVSGATATIPLDGKPEFPVADGRGHIYVNIEDKSEISQIDAKSGKVLATWSVAPCESPSGLAMDTKTRRLFPVCENQMMAVVNADSGKVITTVPIGHGPDAARFDPGTHLIFSSNGEGTLTVVQEEPGDKYSVVQTVQTKRGARTMALDLKTHTVYLSDADFGPAKPGERRPPMLPGTFKVLVVTRQ